MGLVKKTLVELLLLGGLSVALAFGANVLRKERSLKVTKNYFPPRKATEPTTNSPAAKPLPTPPATKAKKLDHEYQEIDFVQVVEVFNDPATRQGLNLFVDARKHEDYDEGHIPGALHCDPYDAEKTMDRVLERANGAERVIVYCGGGDCEDSIFMCRELVEAGVPEESIYLYPGGWTEWEANNMPAETEHEDH